MKKMLKEKFEYELGVGRDFYSKNEFKNAFNHFERAHILGQKYIIPHTQSHFWMLRIGLKTRDVKEIIGQLIRTPLGIIGSLIGVIPTGNTGGSNVRATMSMQIPADLLKIMNEEDF